MNDLYIHYVEHFLHETKTLLPRFTKSKINYKYLQQVADNLTKDETRGNCARVKRLIVQDAMVYPRDFFDYFP
jgi:hypothetical protein